MKRLELVRGLSYYTPGMPQAARKGRPFEAGEDLAAVLLGTGRFAEVEACTHEGQPVADAPDGSVDSEDMPVDGVQSVKDIDSMRMPELIAFAEEHGIDITSCGNNDERKAAIRAALDTADPDGSVE